jgi:putative membrane protein
LLKAIAWLFWIIVIAALVVVGLANRGLVTLRAMPESLATLIGRSPDVQMPLFLVIFLAVAVGLLIGFVWEWLREHPLRAEARTQAQKAQALSRELGRVRSEQTRGGEDILALLETTKRAK